MFIYFSYSLKPAPLDGETWGKGRVIREHCAWKLLPAGRSLYGALGGVFSEACIKLARPRQKSFRISLDTGIKQETVDQRWFFSTLSKGVQHVRNAWQRSSKGESHFLSLLLFVPQHFSWFGKKKKKQSRFRKLKWVRAVTLSQSACFFVFSWLFVLFLLLLV